MSGSGCLTPPTRRVQTWQLPVKLQPGGQTTSPPKGWSSSTQACHSSTQDPVQRASSLLHLSIMHVSGAELERKQPEGGGMSLDENDALRWSR